MLRTEVMAYYQRLGERDRLTATPHGQLEFLRTWDLLTRLLPPPPARVLDVGGGTGVYAGPLAAAGYAVHLIEPVPEQAHAAADLPGVTVTVGDARALPAPDGAADAVLMLGPLYHLPERSERLLAWREAARAVRPGGVVAAATIARFAVMLDGFRGGYYTHPEYAPLAVATLETGTHDPGDRPWFTTAYMHRPDEPAREAADAGLRDARTVAIEGALWLVGPLPDLLADPDQTAALLASLRKLEAEPSLLGASSHLLTTAYR
jgi:SAM-dependent methyltransferase